MEYSSSEYDDLAEDCEEFDEANTVSDADQNDGEVNASNFIDHVSDAFDKNELVATESNGKNQEPFLGMEFESDIAARDFYNSYAIRLGFGIRVARSRSERRKGVEVLVMKRFVCLKEGHHKKKVSESNHKKKRRRLSIRDGCPAMMEVVRRGPEKWVITKLVLEHTHVVVSSDRAREIQLSRLSGKDQEHQNYLKEMRQKVFGDGDAQILLDYFKRMQADNSGFFYAVQVDNRNCITNALWVDAKARMSYSYFGDAVVLDTTFRQNKDMMPIAAFTGVNHHGQTVMFGCALLIEKNEASYAWLFQTWLAAMFDRRPLSITTDQGKAIEAAVAKVFPDTYHRLCKWRILSQCKKKLYDLYFRYPSLHDELKACVDDTISIKAFEIYWASILQKYNLGDNTWLQSLYMIRYKWVPVYLKGSFFAELSTMQRAETMNRFYRNNFVARSSLEVFIAKFDQEMNARYEKESQDDFQTLHSQQTLKIGSQMEKQAASIYTRFVFEKFQDELIEVVDHYGEKISDGSVSRYSVVRVSDPRERHEVYLNVAERKASCSCRKFEVSGILCRHVISVFLLNNVVLLPEHCILKRWTRMAKNGLAHHESAHEAQNYCQNSPVFRYNDLLHDAMKCTERGASSAEVYKMTKHVLQRAFSEIASCEENLAKRALLHSEKV